LLAQGITSKLDSNSIGVQAEVVSDKGRASEIALVCSKSRQTMDEDRELTSFNFAKMQRFRPYRQ